MVLARLIQFEPAQTHLFQEDLENLVLKKSNIGQEQVLLGNLLAQLDVIHFLKNDAAAEKIFIPINNYLEKTQITTLEILNQLEVALTAFEITGNEKYRLKAFNCGQHFYNIRALKGCWFADSFAADKYNLSIIWGISGIARIFLRLYDPTKILSIPLLKNTANGS